MSRTQFRLSTVLLLILMICVCFAWWRDRHDLVQQYSDLQAKHFQLVKYDHDQIRIKLSMINVALFELRHDVFNLRAKKAIEQIEIRLQSSADVPTRDLQEFKQSISGFQQEMEQIQGDCEQSKGSLERILWEFERFQEKLERLASNGASS
jgi:hypothetical protein